jgi:hypothetical protein
MMTIDPEATYELVPLEDDPEDRSYSLTIAGARAVTGLVDREAFADRPARWVSYEHIPKGRWMEAPDAL